MIKKQAILLTTTLFFVLVFCGSVSAVTMDIQAAIDSASPGDTIEIENGLYSENLVIDKQITLKAAPGANVTIKGEDSNKPVILVQGSNTIGTKIQHLTVTGGSDGIAVYDGYNVQINDNTIYKTGYEGIYLYSSNRCLIEGNIITDNQVDGIRLDEWSEDNKISKNFISGNLQHGVYIAFDSNSNAVEENTIRNNQQHGVFIGGTRLNHVYKNQITGNLQDGILLYGADNCLIDYNTISSNQLNGIELWKGLDHRIEHNTITNNGKGSQGSGIYILDTYYAQILENTITQNKGGGVKLEGDHQGTEIHFNRIANNQCYLELLNFGTGSVDATNNWWGVNTNIEKHVKNYGTGSVTFDPWLVFRVYSTPEVIGQGEQGTITADLTKNSAGQNTISLGHIPDGTPISFKTGNGLLQPQTALTTDGIATTLFTSRGKVYSITATLDREDVKIGYKGTGPQV